MRDVPRFLRDFTAVEGACDRCIELVKTSLKRQFPALYVHETHLPD